MKRSSKIYVILLVFLLESAWALLRPNIPLHWYVLKESYRHDKRFAALVAWSDHPTPETKAAYDAEVKLLDEHIAKRQQAIFAGVLAINAVGVYFFWKYAPTKMAA